MKNISLKYIATGLFQKKNLYVSISCLKNDRALHSVGAAMEKGNVPYIFKLCEVKLKKDPWMISVVDVTECRM